jgi:hypothetical protein
VDVEKYMCFDGLLVMVISDRLIEKYDDLAGEPRSSSEGAERFLS